MIRRFVYATVAFIAFSLVMALFVIPFAIGTVFTLEQAIGHLVSAIIGLALFVVGAATTAVIGWKLSKKIALPHQTTSNYKFYYERDLR